MKMGLPRIKEVKTELTKTIDQRPLRALIVPLLLAILIYLSTYHGYIEVSYLEMNIAFLLAFFVEIVLVAALKRNLTKIYWLIGTIAVSIEAVLYNFFKEGWNFPIASIYKVLNGFCGIWLVMSIGVLIFIIIVCVRVVRWSQEDWEKIKAIWRNYRKQWLEGWVQAREAVGQYRMTRQKVKSFLKQVEAKEKIKQRENEQILQSEKREGIYREQRAQNKFNFEMNERRRTLEQLHQEEIDRICQTNKISEMQKELEHENKIREIQRGREIEKEKKGQPVRKENKILRWFSTTGIGILRKIIVLIFVVLYIRIYIEIPKYGIEASHGDGINQWIQWTGKFMESFNNMGQNAKNETDFGSTGAVSVLTEYTIFYIALTGMMFSTLFLLSKMMEGILLWIFKEKHRYTGLTGFFAEYSTPFIVLIIAVSVLLTLNDAGSIMENLPTLFTTLAGTVMSVLIIMIATDAIRLILKQSIESASLLRTSMYLTFMLLIENVMGIVLGVLLAINLKTIIHSVFSFFMPNGNTKFHQNVENALNESLDVEIKKLRRRIRSGNNEKKYRSLFSDFYNKSWSQKSDVKIKMKGNNGKNV